MFELQYQCKICCQKFKLPNQLQTHYWKIHKENFTVETGFEVESESQAQNLKIHKRFQSNGKPLKFKTCKKKFAESRSLNRHEKTHTGQKTFECVTCNKTFSHSHNLKEHKRIHTGEKPFLCNYCNKMHFHY